MTELFINKKLNQLLELDYDAMPENPLDMTDEDGVQFFIKNGDVITNLVDTLFNGDEDAYQVEHDKYTNTNDLFKGLSKIAKKQGKLIYPVTKYEHSQVKYYLGVDPGWDSGVVGFVLVDLKQFKKNYSVNSNAEIEDYLDNWLKEYTDYANGDIYLAVTYQLNSKCEVECELDCMGNLFPDDANIESLFVLCLLGGDLKDWKKATKKVTTSYILAE